MDLPNPVAKVQQVPLWFWISLLLVGCLGFLMWHKFYNDDEDKLWTDPEAAPINADLQVGFQRTLKDMHTPIYGNRERCYPAGNLAEWAHTWIGDC